MKANPSCEIPERLLPVELERELLAGWFRAAFLLEEQPRHGTARVGLETLPNVEPVVFAIHEHRCIVSAMQTVQKRYGSLSPALVRDELRRCRAWDAMRLLPGVVANGPLLTIPTLVAKIRDAARRRGEWRSLQDRRAALLEGP